MYVFNEEGALLDDLSSQSEIPGYMCIASVAVLREKVFTIEWFQNKHNRWIQRAKTLKGA